MESSLTWVFAPDYLLSCDPLCVMRSSFFFFSLCFSSLNYLLPSFCWCVVQKSRLRDKTGGIKEQKQPGIQVEPPLQFSGSLSLGYICFPPPSESFPGSRWYHPSCEISCPAVSLSASIARRCAKYIPETLRIATDWETNSSHPSTCAFQRV